MKKIIDGVEYTTIRQEISIGDTVISGDTVYEATIADADEMGEVVIYRETKIEEDPIQIVYFQETIDNWGRSESSLKPERIKEALKNSEDWTDDMSFESSGGRRYDIDSLLGKKVKVGDDVFVVTDSE